ncbi:MAG: type II toxin-antitoxin system HicB family antitoxin [Tannerella sp.]|jgi:predicted RNase H-like HicB family nuclease|nr:type II toxin-antitoxin system HicB family antitoxin [Tannerella sp.]
MITTALIEKGKDGTFGIFTPDINHTIIGEGNTVAEAKADFENSVQEMILSYAETGRKIPDELKDIRFEYKYDIASMFDFYDWINVTRFARRAGINASLMRQYSTGKAYISDAQIDKIERTMHSLGKELIAVKL